MSDGYLFQFIYRKIKEKHIHDLKANTPIIVESTGQVAMKTKNGIQTFSEFVKLQEESSKKKRVAIDKFTQQPIEIDQELIDQIKQLQAKESV